MSASWASAGVGSWCAEALARSGVGALTLMDQDTVDRSNLNRQAEALESTLGMPKAEAMAARVLDVNPHCRVRPIRGRYESASREAFFSVRYDYVVDAIDLVSCKLDLIETALARNLPIISALGTGNKLDASLLRVSDISKTEGCPLARVIRKELRARGIHHHKVVWSPEEARKPDQPEAPPPGRRSVPAQRGVGPRHGGASARRRGGHGPDRNPIKGKIPWIAAGRPASCPCFSYSGPYTPPLGCLCAPSAAPSRRALGAVSLPEPRETRTQA